MLSIVGPGVVVAATGVGAGDMVAAAKAGANYGLIVLWAAALGALLKLGLAEGIARWQLATGTTLLTGWFRNFGWPVRVYFTAYLAIWTVAVSAALMAACGLAGHALAPFLSVEAWAIIHALLALALVWCEGYTVIERIMRWAIGLMFVTIVGAAVLNPPAPGVLLSGLLLPRVPLGGTLLVAGVVGGVGGTLTLMSYSYWLQEKGWSGTRWLPAVRFDLLVGYALTGIFGVALTALGGMVLHPRGLEVTGSKGVVEMAVMLGEGLGRAGELIFLIGFWAAVATSIVGVWQGVPYLFAHVVKLLRSPQEERLSEISTRSPLYRLYLVLMTFPPMLLLLIGRPVYLVVAYAALGSLFMPFLAATLLLLNNRRSQLGAYRNGVVANLVLVICLLLFAYLGVVEIGNRIWGG
jgi:Mn2+/Fe2+ NRAMP family transporter